MKKITVLLVDDHKMVTNAIAFMLSDDGRFQVVGEAVHAGEAMSMVIAARPAIVLVEINMKDGFEIINEIRKLSPGSKVIGVSVHALPAYAKRVIKAGGWGYVTKNSSSQDLLQIIVDVHEGKKSFCNEIKERLAGQLLLDDDNNQKGELSQRELDVIGYIKHGLTSKEIGELMYISTKTVEVHRYNILKKLKLKNSAALVNYINSQGL